MIFKCVVGYNRAIKENFETNVLGVYNGKTSKLVTAQQISLCKSLQLNSSVKGLNISDTFYQIEL